MKRDQMGAPAVDPRSSQTTALKLDAVYSGVRLTGRIAGFFEEAPAFVGAEQGADVAQGGPERLERARGRLAQERFDLGERHLDWVQIGRVLRQEQEPGPRALSAFAARALLWTERLSAITTSPGRRVGASWVST